MFGIDDIAMALLMAAPGIMASTFGNKSPKVENQQFSTQNSAQQKMMNRVMKQLSPELIGQLFGPIDEGKLRDRFDRTTGDPARKQFTEQRIPEMQELFAGMGIRGGDLPQYQLASGAERLEEGLAGQFEGLYGQEEDNRRKSIMSLLGMDVTGNQPTMTSQNYGSAFGDPLMKAGSDIFSMWQADKLRNPSQVQTPLQNANATAGNAIWGNIQKYAR